MMARIEVVFILDSPSLFSLGYFSVYPEGGKGTE
jgi:hypothetical protein